MVTATSDTESETDPSVILSVMLPPLLIVHLSSQCFYSSSFGFAFQTLFLGPLRWLRLVPSFTGNHYTPDEISEPIECIFSILQLGAIPLRLDDDYAFFRNTMIL